MQLVLCASPTASTGKVVENAIFTTATIVCTAVVDNVHTRIYNGSAPRAADAACYGRAKQRRMHLQTCERGRKKRPMTWCEKRVDNAKSCLQQIALLCSAVLCAFVTGVTF